MGTRITITTVARNLESAEEGAEAAVREILNAEHRLSTWMEDSEISRVNRMPRDKWVRISPRLLRDLRAALTVSDLTNGTFRPTLGALVTAWRIENVGGIPTSDEISAAMTASSVAGFEIESDRLRRLNSDMRFDTGAFGKGIALDDAASAALTTGALGISMNFGGQILHSGECPGLEVGIAHPQHRTKAVLTVNLDAGSLATSGTWVRRHKVGSREITHILDPATGTPLSVGSSVTVLAPTAFLADAFSTALLIMGPDRGTRWLSSHSELAVDALWLSPDGRIAAATPGIFSRLVDTPRNHAVSFDINQKMEDSR